MESTLNHAVCGPSFRYVDSLSTFWHTVRVYGAYRDNLSRDPYPARTCADEMPTVGCPFASLAENFSQRKFCRSLQEVNLRLPIFEDCGKAFLLASLGYTAAGISRMTATRHAPGADVGICSTHRELCILPCTPIKYSSPE